jgi:sarcosine oxidase, subunit beta
VVVSGVGRPRVVVVGGGVEGLASAYALATRDVADVVVLERDELCQQGTGRSSGVVRCHYGVPSLAAMAWRGTQVLEGGEELLGAPTGFVRTGYVVGVGPPDVDALATNVAMHRGLGIDVELVDHDAVAALWPDADLDDFAAFAHEPRGGFGDAYTTGMSFAAAARRAGATIRRHAPVAALVTKGERVAGVTLADGERVDADVVVVAAGAWSVPLCGRVGVDLPIRAQREQILLVDPGRDLGMVPVLSDLVSLQYLRAEVGGGLLVGNSDHRAPEYVDPDDYVVQPDEDFVEQAASKVVARFPRLDVQLTHGYSGCYDVTPDFNPMIGPVGPEGLLVAAGFSGHGYKISPAVGELVADLVVDGASAHPDVPAEDFRVDRFADGVHLVGTHRYVGAGQMR